MSSTPADSRSSSAVRNLRSIFENKASESSNTLTPDSRGRSPNGVGSDKENGGRPTSKVRASFVAVEPVASMSERRGSFGEADGDLGLKKTISEQQEVLDVPEAAVESAAASAVGTPVVTSDVLQLGEGGDKPANPDKPVTGTEEEPGEMKPAEPSNELAVSGGEALPPVAEDLRSAAKATTKSVSKPQSTPTGKPPAISTKPSTKPSASSIKSPVSQPKTPTSAKTPASTDSPVTKRPPRSSLTAPTAASMARAGASDKPPTSKTSPTVQSRPRESTKPLNLSSHLTAPTTSSKAKHEPDAPSAPALRATLVHRPKPPISTKPRSSLAAAPRPTSRDSSYTARRSLAPVDGSFLDRMTRPTAASANRTTEKAEAKSPPSKAKVPVKPKVNGVPKAAPANPAVEDASAAEASVGSPIAISEAPALSFAGAATTVEDAVAVADAQALAGNETPTHTNGEANPALEATPAGLAVDDTIR